MAHGDVAHGLGDCEDYQPVTGVIRYQNWAVMLVPIVLGLAIMLAIVGGRL